MVRKQTNIYFDSESLRPALEYIESYWRKLERFRPHDDGTLIGLPKPYFVPSAANESMFAYEEMYYWDTYFIAQGLVGTPREYLLRGLAENLVSLMQRFQIIPNSGRLYHTSRSQPPFLSTLIMQVYRIERDKKWLRQAMTVAKEEYRSVWMGASHPNWRQVFHGLSRFYDINMIDDLAEAESGWDMTTRFYRRSLSYIPVDLNALLYKYESDFADASDLLDDHEEAQEWRKRMMARRASIRTYLWDEEKRCYFDYNYMSSKRSNIYSLATFFPMWAGLDDHNTAEKIMSRLDLFEYEGGLATTAQEPHVETPIPTQWAYPNGWAPLQLVAIEAMDRYGFREDAERIARKWIKANLINFEKRGVFLEKYNVVDVEEDPIEGLYPSQEGFGWTNAVFLRLCMMYLNADELPAIHVSSPSQDPIKRIVGVQKKALRQASSRINGIIRRSS